jgi:DNA-binding transcriptional MerR regulator
VDDDHMDNQSERWQIGQFAELVGLSIPQLRRYDRLRLLEPDGREAQSGYRYYTPGQTGAARAIALLRSLDMPIADIRRILAGASDAERRELFRDHRARLEARLDEVRRLLEAVDALTQEDHVTADAPTDLTTWLHMMPRLPVTDIDRSVAYYQEALGFRLAWRTADGSARSTNRPAPTSSTPWLPVPMACGISWYAIRTGTASPSAVANSGCVKSPTTTASLPRRSPSTRRGCSLAASRSRLLGRRVER